MKMAMWIRDDYGIQERHDFWNLEFPDDMDRIWDAIRDGKTFIDLRKEKTYDGKETQGA